MSAILSILIGIYIVVDAAYLAAIADSETRHCMIGKHAGAVMSGLYMIVGFHNDFTILFGVTIALFMWPDTYFRLLDYLQAKNHRVYLFVIGLFKHRSRRKSGS
ncbi:hypothetical protein C3Y98_04735 [Methylotenera oryzisoli]|uniref:Uncharacterized protein n=1 Tax=Methylotenera oryzisoli TaxID=2080758 RepID=A0A4Y9VQY0_9PROT|nr:hypothetical protein [Methylotenera oryzisoli]TFW71415.1 hypothetical protein C3Y98_04735 [Methylotenera oryzisoli]